MEVSEDLNKCISTVASPQRFDLKPLQKLCLRLSVSGNKKFRLVFPPATGEVGFVCALWMAYFNETSRTTG